MSHIIGRYSLFVKRRVKNDSYLFWLIHKADNQTHIPSSLFRSFHHQATIIQKKENIHKFRIGFSCLRHSSWGSAKGGNFTCTGAPLCSFWPFHQDSHLWTHLGNSPSALTQAALFIITVSISSVHSFTHSFPHSSWSSSIGLMLAGNGRSFWESPGRERASPSISPWAVMRWPASHRGNSSVCRDHLSNWLRNQTQTHQGPLC